jgi:Chaperone of endosialidase
MGDISTWSPVDESNTMAPPNGWPEGQATNTVNNCARAMMGAVRRWYDTVTAQLANYLPLTGGSLSGPLSATLYQLSGVAFAQRDVVNNQHVVFDADGVDPALVMGGAVAGYNNYYRAETHRFQSNNGAIDFAVLNTGGLTIPTSFSVPNASISGTVQAGQVTSNADIDAAGNIDAGGTITAGNISSNGAVNATQYNLRGYAFAEMDAGAVRTAIYGPGFVSISMFGSGTNYYDNNQHYMRSGGGGTTYFIASGGGTFNQTGSWGVISDDSLKQNVAPYNAGLAQLRQLNPVSFEYTSRAALRGMAGTVNYGLMASEVRPVIPEMIQEIELDQDGVPTPTQTLLPTHLVYILINTCKELAARIEQLEGEAHVRQP